MSGGTTDVIYHRPGSPDYEDKTTHHISISGPKMEQVRDYLVEQANATQVFPVPHEPQNKNCRLEFAAQLQPAEVEAKVVAAMLRWNYGDIRFTVRE